MPKASTPKLNDAEQVAQFMDELEHPYKAEINSLRKIITKANSKMSERIKWNAPSYYYIEDIVTFGPMKQGKIMLVFHHPYVVKIKSELLQGDYKDRRLVYFKDAKDIKANQKELSAIVDAIVVAIDKNKK